MDSVAIDPPDTSIGQAVMKARDEIKHLREKLLVKRGEGRVDVSSVEEALFKTEEMLKRRTDDILDEINNRVQTLPFSAVQAAVSPLDHQKQQFGDDANEQEAQTYHLTTVVPLFTSDTPVDNAKMRRKVNTEPQSDKLPHIPSRAPSKQQPERYSRNVEALSPLTLKYHKEPELVVVDGEAPKGLANLVERGLVPRATHIVFEPNPMQHRMAALHDRSELPPTQSRVVLPSAEVTLAIEHFPEKMEALEKSRLAIQIPMIEQIKEKKRVKKRKSDKDLSARNLAMITPTATPAVLQPDLNPYHFAVVHGRVREHSNEFITFKRENGEQWSNIAALLSQLLRVLVNYSIPMATVDGHAVLVLTHERKDSRGKATLEQLLSCLVNRQEVEEFMRIPGRRYVAHDGRVAAATKIQTCWRRHWSQKVYRQYRKQQWAVGVISSFWFRSCRILAVRKALRTRGLRQLENLRLRNARLAESWKRVQNENHVVIHLPSLGFTKRKPGSGEHLCVPETAQIGRLFELADANVDVVFLSAAPTSDEFLHYYAKMISLRKAVICGDQSQTQMMEERYKIIVPESFKLLQSRNLPLSTHLKYSPRTLKRIKNIIRGRTAYIVPGLPTADDVHVAEELGVAMLSAEPDVAQLYSSKSGAKRILRAANVSTAPFEYDIYSLQQLHESLAQLITRHILTVKRYLLKMDSEQRSRGLALLDVSTALPCYAWAWREADRYSENWNQTWAQEQVLLKVLEQVPLMLEKHAQPLCREAYPSWTKYCQQFVAGGGVVEAVAPGDCTCFSVDCLIQPDGELAVLCSGDHIHLRDESFFQAAVSVPQCSVDAPMVNEACLQIAEACKQRKIIGYFCVDFATFVDVRSNEQIVWATDLKLQYSEQLANFQLVKFVTNGDFAAETHEISLAKGKKPSSAKNSTLSSAPSRESLASTTISIKSSTSMGASTVTGSSNRSSTKSAKERRTKVCNSRPRANQRFAVLSARLHHSNVGLMQYNVFFQLCRANGIGFDIKEKEGSLFLLRDPTKREFSTMVTVSDRLGDALALFAKNLNVLHQEASSSSTTAKENFKALIEDIDSIMKLLGLNISDDKNKQKLKVTQS